MIKRFTLLALSVFAISFCVKAQQDPYYTQFMFNQMAYNPAYAGSKDRICATLLYKNQWTGFEGAPLTQTATINAPIKSRFGVGLGIINDALGYEKSLNLTLSFAAKFNIGNGVLAVGPGIGFMQKSLDGTKLLPKTFGDPLIPNATVSDLKPDLNFGFLYKNDNFNNLFVGLSSTHLLESKLSYGNVNYPLARHYYFVAGMAMPIGRGNLVLEPNVNLRSDGTKTQIDVAAFLLINNKIRGGLSYRTGDMFAPMLGYKFSDNFYVGYAYDFTTSRIKNFSGGSHEIFGTYCFKFKTREPSPSPINKRRTPRFL